MDKVRTVSDTKRDFYTHHNRPINSIYRRVVEELMVEMHLLSVNANFKVDPIYCLGVVTSFDRFMNGYKPEKDKESIFSALCQSVGGDPQEYRKEAENTLEIAQRIPKEELVSWIGSPNPTAGTENIAQVLQEIASNSDYKYSRLFGIGLYTILDKADPELVKDKETRDRYLQQISEALQFSTEKLQKDLDLYRSNIEKMEQVLNVMEEAIIADRKKREQRLLEKTQEKPEEKNPQENNAP
ncbi:MAG: photosystem II biogenesis protein Psp29 [Prochloraceae cyanobacterium]|nr:photosystem II biogenesis protein Psp29 [Prochloraceae cyanobacterium]